MSSLEAMTTKGGFNVCGIVIHCAPDKTPAVSGALAALPGVEVHTVTDDHRMVATVTDTENAMAIDQLAAINRIPGVVSATLAYHEVDTPHAPAACCGAGDCQH